LAAPFSLVRLTLWWCEETLGASPYTPGKQGIGVDVLLQKYSCGSDHTGQILRTGATTICTPFRANAPSWATGSSKPLLLSVK
jgi:hypothetical protein